jgi:hypothetical protein
MTDLPHWIYFHIYFTDSAPNLVDKIILFYISNMPLLNILSVENRKKMNTLIAN